MPQWLRGFWLMTKWQFLSQRAYLALSLVVSV